MRRLNLDMDVLRTIVTAQRLGGFNKAAQQIGRSQSAVSQQIRKLEEQLGLALFEKQGRGLALTGAGTVLINYAQRILDLNDEAVIASRGHAVEGLVRFGLPADFAESGLPIALGAFKRAHPTVRIEVVVDRNRRLLQMLDEEQLDLALAIGSAHRGDAELIAEMPMVWIGAASTEPLKVAGAPLPLVGYEPPCFFRDRATKALDQAGMPWRAVFTSASLHGLWAAVQAGLGITARIAVGLPEGVVVLDDSHGLPAIANPPLAVCLHGGGREHSPAAARLRTIVAETILGNLAKRRAG